MSRLVVPLRHRKLWAAGDVLLRAELELRLKDGAGNWAQEIFRVDSATEMTTMPAFRARQLNLPYPQQPALGVTHAQTGLELRSGYLQVTIVWDGSN
jgi:hypothetical protein